MALILVDSGFSQTLIRKSDPTDDDYRSVFGLNLALAAVLYALLHGGGAVALARF